MLAVGYLDSPYTLASVAQNGASALCFFTENDSVLRAVTIASDGTLVGTPVALTYPFGVNIHDLDVAPFGAGYLAVWREVRAWDDEAYTSHGRLYYAVLDALGQPTVVQRTRLCTNEADQARPSVASDGTAAFIAWVDSREATPRLYGTKITSDGNPAIPAGFPLGADAAACEHTSMCFGHGKYALTHVSGAEWPQTTSVMLLDTEGHSLGPATTLVGVQGDPLGGPWESPLVRTGSDGFAVVWFTYDAALPYRGRLYLSRLDVNGQPYGAPTLLSDDAWFYGEHCGLIFDGTRWFCTWDVGSGDGQAGVQRHGAFVDASGSVSPTGGFVVTDRDPILQTNVAIAANGDSYLAAWRDYRYDGKNAQVDNRCYFGRISGAGTVLDPRGIDVDGGDDTTTIPAVCARGSEWWVVWARAARDLSQTIAAVRVGSDGTIVEPGRISLATAGHVDGVSVASGSEGLVAVYGSKYYMPGTYCSFVDQTGDVSRKGMYLSNGYTPAVASCGSQFLVVFTDQSSPFTFPLKAMRLGATGEILDATPIAIGTVGPHYARPSIASDGVSYAIAVPHGTAAGDPGTWFDVFVVSTSGTVTRQAQVPVTRADITDDFGRGSSSSLSWTGTCYMLTWRGGANIYRMLLDRQMVPLGPEQLVVTAAETTEGLIDAACNSEGRITTLWEDPDPTIGGNYIFGVQQNLTVPSWPTYEQAAGTWLMGLPFAPHSRDAAQVFATTSVTGWDVSTQTYHLYQGQAFNVTPGYGYWAKYDTPQTLRMTGPAVNGPVTCDVWYGWNLLGNPYQTSMAWSQVVGNGLLEPFAWRQSADGTGYELVSDVAGLDAAHEIPAWRGLWVWANAAGEVSLAAATATEAHAAAQPSATWSLRLLASVGSATTGASFIGRTAGEAALQIAAPPPLATRDVDLYILDAEGEHRAVSLLPTGAEAAWDVCVETRVSGAPVSVRFPDLSSVPARLGLTLSDLDAGRTVNMRTSASYAFTAGEGTTVRHLRIAAAERRLCTLVISAASACAVPDGVAIGYCLSSAAEVEISIHNIAGRTVATIPVGYQAGGTHTSTWSGRSRTGTRVPSGRYLLRITAADTEGNRASVLVPLTR
ncbi:hypothetical protein LLH23_11175 [bacterium]|nr:hypothetical protein [bacterium]